MHNNSIFQNIVYALIVRSKDGMPLSATTDFTDELHKNIKECKRYLKLVSKKAQNFPERCILHLHQHTIYFVTHLGVTYLVLCISSYPTVLAFSFLNEMMKEFIMIYDQLKIREAVRPYSFMEFDNFIHKTCQRYNKPQSLTTRINLSELSLEVRLRPPYEVKLDEVEPSKSSQNNNIPYPVGQRFGFEDLSFFSFMNMVLTIILSLVSTSRGIATISESSYEDLKENMYLHGIIFLTDAILRLLQVYLLLFEMKLRITKSWLDYLLLCWSIWNLSDLRDNWQTVMYFIATTFTHLAIITRRVKSKLPDYQV